MKLSLNEVVDLLIAALGFPRQRLQLVVAKRFATSKDMARRGEKQEDVKDQPQACHDEDVCNEKATVCLNKEKSKQEMPCVFAIMKKPSSRRRMAGLSNKL